MAIAVSLRDLVDELQMLPKESNAYLNKVTGKVITISDDDIAMAEIDQEIEADLEDAGEETIEEVKSRIWKHSFITKYRRFWHSMLII